MSWPTVKISEVAEINPKLRKGVDEAQDITFLPMAAISENGKVIGGEIRKLKDVKKGFTYFERKDILIAKITPCFENGKAAILNDLPTPIGFGSTEFHVIRPIASKVDPEYLFTMLWNTYFRTIGADNMTGSAGQKRLPVKFIHEFSIPLPPLSLQKDISERILKSRQLIQQSIAMESQLNALAQAVFVDMFGDPLINSKGWDTKKLKDLGELNRGKSKHRPRNDPKLLGGFYPLIQTGDVARADNYIVHYNSTYSELGLKQSKLWPKGTLCITIAANIADTAILSFDACFPDSVVGFNANTNLTSNEFIHYWLKFYQSTLEQLAPESAQKNINLKILEEIDVFVPPLIHQLEFVAILSAIEGRKKDARRQNECLYKCFSALMQRAFSGKLDLKKVA
ncbi:restriction endonuclease subunit S [Serratia marcescens]|uniref:restriction endonuclease subunit S n=1 Tax=Serratia marcescens TaxID=615 RepID=UPI00317740A3